MRKSIKLIGTLFFISTMLFSCGSSNGVPSNNQSPNNGQSTEINIYSDSSRKIIYTLNYSIKSDDISSSAKTISEEVYLLNGYISSSTQSSSSYFEFTYKVPTEKLNDFLSFMNNQGDVIAYQSLSSEDVTTSYNNIQAEINVLEASKSAYENLLRNENLSFDEIFKINDKIDEINISLEILYLKLDSTSEKVDYATINITFSTINKQSKIDIFVNALKDAGINILYFLLYTSPFALIAGIAILISYLIFKRKHKTIS